LCGQEVTTGVELSLFLFLLGGLSDRFQELDQDLQLLQQFKRSGGNISKRLLQVIVLALASRKLFQMD
jgi:hypothetical protein